MPGESSLGLAFEAARRRRSCSGAAFSKYASAAFESASPRPPAASAASSSAGRAAAVRNMRLSARRISRPNSRAARLMTKLGLAAAPSEP